MPSFHGGCFLDNLAGGIILDLGDGKTAENFRVVGVVVLKISIEFIVLGVIKKSHPLLVLVVLLDHIVQKVFLKRDRYSSKELIIVLVLDDDAEDLLGFCVTQWHHDCVRILKISTVNEFHVAVGVETHFLFFFVILGARFEIDIVHSHIQLVAKSELATPCHKLLTLLTLLLRLGSGLKFICVKLTLLSQPEASGALTVLNTHSFSFFLTSF